MTLSIPFLPTVSEAGAVLGGPAVIGGAFANYDDAVRRIRAGLPCACVREAGRWTGLALDVVCEIIGASCRAFDGREARPGARLTYVESERLLHLARVFAGAVQAFGGQERARAWIGDPNPRFDGHPPYRRLQDDADVALVEAELARLAGEARAADG